MRAESNRGPRPSYFDESVTRFGGKWSERSRQGWGAFEYFEHPRRDRCGPYAFRAVN